ncbi:hypothetical protein F7725_020030 [Dissostichus mawsoni]|uniref:Uncharacterized protein n=1 Tax=Dissostichus mawsoni TaxID=36200 RepID=A0A7J5YMZ0_DISMA|nr:hypothetical protein F7725_020030 [Dissostichus mawsoni]
MRCSALLGGPSAAPGAGWRTRSPETERFQEEDGMPIHLKGGVATLCSTEPMGLTVLVLVQMWTVTTLMMTAANPTDTMRTLKRLEREKSQMSIHELVVFQLL